jgi:hypothetical protein
MNPFAERGFVIFQSENLEERLSAAPGLESVENF